MTSPQANSLVATLMFLAVLLALWTRSIWRQVLAWQVEQKRREDAGEIPYVRDEERAKLIAQHPLLQMPSRKKVG